MASSAESTFSHINLRIEEPDAFALLQLRADGRLTFTLSIENRSSVPAQLPFLCLMDLGLNLEAHRNWNAEKISADGRKLVRFAYRPATALMTGQKMPVCSLVVRLTNAGGWQASLGQSAPMLVDSMKNIRLFAITGAANFPAQRGSIEVQADHIRSSLQKAFAAAPAHRAAG